MYQKEQDVPTNELNTVSEVETEEIKNIRLGISNIDTLNPLTSKNQNVQDMSMLVYEPLLYVTEDFNLEYRSCNRVV